MNIILNYLEIGFLISAIIKLGLWVTHRPNLSLQETIATILVWPVVIKESIQF